MQVHDIMTPEFQACSPRATLRDAAQMMRDLDVGILPIASGDELVGVVTDRDICCRGVADGADPEAVMVQEIMSQPLLRCYEDEDVAEAARLMEDRQVRRLLVYNRQERPVGVLAQADIALNPETARFVTELVHDISEPGPGHHRPAMH
ncbi:CBS domain-containing protein [Alkalilimnicola sp. S0819]|uniref:CBS domain-containing protein n=1 Tax=Alkalilimnicola sp. S0819 TaxID=2613922 RepID=UPI001261F853|nr:CBS domain-containing protein [Alkalilimnicola sp. S0819]KAB7619546.1 CBS domain-containing protein [Alkalilimnicola sp. S0819]MPQ17653.1 CBS domain-containing protein [Alkalilimnicola sp. S0819]